MTKRYALFTFFDDMNYGVQRPEDILIGVFETPDAARSIIADKLRRDSDWRWVSDRTVNIIDLDTLQVIDVWYFRRIGEGSIDQTQGVACWESEVSTLTALHEMGIILEDHWKISNTLDESKLELDK